MFFCFLQHNVSCHSQICDQETEGVEGPVNQCKSHWWIWDFFCNSNDLDTASTPQINQSGVEFFVSFVNLFYNVAENENLWAVTTKRCLTNARKGSTIPSNFAYNR